MAFDHIYARPMADIADFRFDAQVADVFSDMMERSVPGYQSIIAMLTLLAARHARPGSCLYDLGCSIGASSLAMSQGAQGKGCTIIAVDDSEAMLARCRENLAEDHSGTKFETYCADIRQLDVQSASIVVLNFTLQFIPPEDRDGLLKRIAKGMLPGGLLVLSEKIRIEDADIHRHITDLHLDFKRANGYSKLEISQKRTALENVLKPETITAHRRRLMQAGFASVETWLQCFNFMSLLAVK